MRVKITFRLWSARVSSRVPISSDASELRLPCISTHDIKSQLTSVIHPLADSQKGAGTWLLSLFAMAILVTAIVALSFGHKIGYQRGYYALQTETDRVFTDTEKAEKELKDLRLSSKILENQADTAIQELEISLANLEELRQVQKAVKIDSQQVEQLNKLYAKVIVQQGGLPLQVLGAKIEPLPENAFEYGFDIGMLSKDAKAKKLNVTLSLQNADSFIEVPLSPASYVIEGIVRIRGRFVMPVGFKPLQVKLSLAAGGQEVEQLYDWKLGDMIDSMPLSLLDLPEVDSSPIATDKPPITATPDKE